VSTITSAAEAFSVAVQIEKNGIDFYRTAARIHKSDEDSKELLRLASMEDDHRAVFENMVSRATGRVSRESLDYLQAIADSHGGEGDPLSADLLGGDETLEEILETAISLEERSILFYVGLRDIAPDPQTLSAIDRIIGEERAHIVAIGKRLAAAR
jgi:rubrerythrin